MNIESFDLYNPPTDFIDNVYKYYKLLREKSPIHQNPDGSYVLTTYKEIISNARSVLESKQDELEAIVNDHIEEAVLEFRENIVQLAANNNFTDEDIQIIIAGCRTSDEYKDLEDIENHEIRNVLTSTFCNF